MDMKKRLQLAKTIPGATTRLGWTNRSDAFDVAGQAARTGRVAQITTGADRGRHLYEVELLVLNASSDAQVARYRSGGVFFWTGSPQCPRIRITLDIDADA